MTSELAHLIEMLCYVVAGRLVIKLLNGGWREFAFAVLNSRSPS